MSSTAPPTGETLASQLQKLHTTLPAITFRPQADILGCELPQAQVYLQHYGLDGLIDDPSCRHFLGRTHCCGYNIAGQYWLPASPSGTVFVVHGYFDHVGLYGHLIRHLLDCGLAVVAFDLPGHGLSDGERVTIASFDHYVDVFETVVGLAEANLPQPWHTVGQSTGGAIVLNHLLAKPELQTFDNVALLAPLLHPRNWSVNKMAYKLCHRILPSIWRSFQTNSSDAAFVDFLKDQDPLQARHIPLEWIGAMSRWAEAFHLFPESTQRLRVIQGDRDTTLDWRYNMAQLRTKFPAGEFHLVPGARHHLVNESPILRQQVFSCMGFEKLPSSQDETKRLEA